MTVVQPDRRQIQTCPQCHPSRHQKFTLPLKLAVTARPTQLRPSSEGGSFSIQGVENEMRSSVAPIAGECVGPGDGHWIFGGANGAGRRRQLHGRRLPQPHDVHGRHGVHRDDGHEVDPDLRPGMAGFGRPRRTGTRDCRINDPEFDSSSTGDGKFWEETIGAAAIKGDVVNSTLASPNPPAAIARCGAGR